jgi:hypothetical protein
MILTETAVSRGEWETDMAAPASQGENLQDTETDLHYTLSNLKLEEVMQSQQESIDDTRGKGDFEKCAFPYTATVLHRLVDDF